MIRDIVDMPITPVQQRKKQQHNWIGVPRKSRNTTLLVAPAPRSLVEGLANHSCNTTNPAILRDSEYPCCYYFVSKGDGRSVVVGCHEDHNEEHPQQHHDQHDDHKHERQHYLPTLAAKAKRRHIQRHCRALPTFNILSTAGTIRRRSYPPSRSRRYVVQSQKKKKDVSHITGDSRGPWEGGMNMCERSLGPVTVLQQTGS